MNLQGAPGAPFLLPRARNKNPPDTPPDFPHASINCTWRAISGTSRRLPAALAQALACARNPVAQSSCFIVCKQAPHHPATKPVRQLLCPRQERQLCAGLIYDKATGFKVKPGENGKISRNDAGMPAAVDDNGNPITDKQGNPAYYDSRGTPVVYEGKGADGITIYKDAKTGELETITQNGAVYKVDPATNAPARDADGNLMPALYDPVDDDPTRPPVRPNENRETMLKNLPKGKERGDPMAIKDELFDEYGNLDVDKLARAAGKYDARDVYDALINSSKSGGWDNLTPELRNGGTLAHPDEDRSRDVIISLIAWQNENGRYNPIKQGNVPAVLFYNGGRLFIQGFESNGVTYVGLDRIEAPAPRVIFHELNHRATSKAFWDAYKAGSADAEAVTEYLATLWTGNGLDSGYETDRAEFFRYIDNAVEKMGNGNINKGMDLLKRAYYSGDLVALEQLKKYLPPGDRPPDTGYHEYEPGNPDYTA